MAEWMQRDYTTIPKTELVKILQDYNIRCSPSDTVADLRPKLAILRTALKLSGEEAQEIRSDILRGARQLTDIESALYPSLVELQKIINTEHIYYTPPLETVLVKEPKENQYVNRPYEEIIYPTVATPKVPVQEAPKMAVANEKSPLVPAGNFSGQSSESSILFIEKFELAASCNQWGDVRKAQLFPVHLGGPALTWYATYKKRIGEENIEWGSMKSEFIKAFTPIAQNTNLQLIMAEKVQRGHQTATDFMWEVIETCRVFNPNLPEEEVVEYVIMGLQPWLCSRLTAEKIETVQQLEDMLKKVEMERIRQHQNKNKYERSMEHSYGNKEEQPERSMFNSNQLMGERISRKQNFEREKMCMEHKGIETMQEKIMKLESTVAALTIDKLRDPATSTSRERFRDGRGTDYDGGRQREDRINHGSRGRREEDRSSRRVWFGVGSSQSRNKRSYSSERRPTSQHREQGDRYCMNCKMANHNTEECRVVQRARRDKSQQRYDGPRRPLRCYNCNSEAHLARNCTVHNLNTNRHPERQQYCAICRRSNHSTDKCFFNAKNGFSKGSRS